MKNASTLETTRLRLRRWRVEDLSTFAALNADPAVMEFFSKPLSMAESDAVAARSEAIRTQGVRALGGRGEGGRPVFIGFVGLSTPGFEAHFTPCVEIGWRLAREHWGRGYAPRPPEPPSTTASARSASARSSLSRSREPPIPGRHGADRHDAVARRRLDHPVLPEGHPLRPHVLYRTT